MTTHIKYQIQQASEQLSNQPKLMRLRISELNQMYIVHKSIVKQLHEHRQGNANCKTRSEVKGGGKKPWKQKGTGKARAGSIRSPLWRGGGVVFGPKAKEYNKKINKKEKQLAIRNLLYNKQNFTFAIEQRFLQFDQPKTQVFLQRIQKIGLSFSKKLLIIMAQKHKNTYLSTRNLANVEIIAANQLNPLSIIKAEYLLIEIDAIKIIQDTYNG